MKSFIFDETYYSMRKILFTLFLLGFTFSNAQAPEKWSSSDIYSEIQKLNFLGSVLYVAAHPDDENTRLISHFSNEVNARTAYLSLTRGDGGQNLVGPELREQLGMIRTQELLAARKIDGGEQFFTRANDFGYSKTPSETLEIWNKNEVLSDVVWIIRKFRPDVIINRFDHRTPGSTHGHHTCSAMLSLEAFEMAGDASKFQDQLELVGTYDPKRLFFNTSPWFYGGTEAFEEADKSRFLTFDTGTYFPMKGLSNPEIASLSRSQHKSQGFGSTGSRGKQKEYIELIKGEMPTDETNIFDGIDTSWNRIQGGKEIGSILTKVQENFDFEDPSKILPELLKAYHLIQDLQDKHWLEIKTREIKDIIYASSGLYLEAIADRASVTPSEEVPIKLEAINRSAAQVKLISVELVPNNTTIEPAENLDNNSSWNENLEFRLPENADFTNPYWLKFEGSIGMYKVDDQNLRGLPQTPLQNKAIFNLEINGEPITFEKPILYKFNDPVSGETYENFKVIPKAELNLHEDILVFNSSESKTAEITIQANQADLSGTLKLKSEKDWSIKPAEFKVNIAPKGGTQTFKFSIFPPEGQSEITLHPVLETENNMYDQNVISIDYDYIPGQNLIQKSKLELVKLDIKKKGEIVGYIAGAGDVVPEAIRQMGYKVDMLNPSTINVNSLKKYDAVVLGIRSFNIIEDLKFQKKQLFKYVEEGGNLIVQYNTNRGLVTDQIAPFNLQLSRDRVTNENAEVGFNLPEHELLNSPNKLGSSDFKNWVQERGLYFADSWSAEFEAPLYMNDPNEEPSSGSLLVARYGKGYYIYTGLSFFRQFPEAVPGAYRLFANMISLGK